MADVSAGGKRWKLGDFAKAQRQAKAATKEWTSANPKRDGENKTAYRKRAKAGIETKLKADGADTDWLALIMQIVELILALFA